MAHDILGAETHHRHILQCAQDAHRPFQSGGGAGGQINLRQVAGDHHAPLFSHAGEEHFHLDGGAILRLVQNHRCIRQCAPAHEGQRRDFNLAGFHAAQQLLRRQAVVQGVIEGAQIGVDFVAHITGEEAQTLSRLHCRAREDDAPATPFQQIPHGHGNREIGFAGAGRADAENQRIVLHGGDITRLGGGTRRNGTFARGNAQARVGVPTAVDGGGRVVGAHLAGSRAHRPGNFAHAYALPVLDLEIQVAQGAFGNDAGRARPGDDKAIAARGGFDVQAAFNMGEMAVMDAEQGAEQTIVAEIHEDAGLTLRVMFLHIGDILQQWFHGGEASARAPSREFSPARRMTTGTMRPSHSAAARICTG